MSDLLDPRARSLFSDALGLAGAERDAFLARECAQDPELRARVDELLLAHAQAEGRLVESVEQIGEQPDDRIGPYTLVNRLGEGGFGTVWRAEQAAPIRRTVAVKILKPGMDTRQVIGRFEAERQALALMDHPNIARIFDGGATVQGRPYFVMELVDGVPITNYCDDSGLTTAERIELFVPVCQAVQHAHQKGVIHRDLKPSNVLITEQDGKAVAKIIDFGIAKAITPELKPGTALTGLHQLLGTPEYMAPEQADPDARGVDTRVDIYSLGVVLYELLTGCRPFEVDSLLQHGQAELVRTLLEVDPPKPSTRVSSLGQAVTPIAQRRRIPARQLESLLRGDLDWIVMKALEKERARRYETASAFADDLQRHLHHEVVLAGPATRTYRLRRFVRRNRVAVIAGAAVAVALAGGTIAATSGYLEAKAQTGKAETSAKKARREATKANEVITLLEELLKSGDPHVSKDPAYTVRQLLDDFARKHLTDQLGEDPEVEAELRTTVGRSYLGLGLPKEAEPHLSRAAELLKKLRGADDVDAILRDVDLATCFRDEAKYEEARVLLTSIADRQTRSDPIRERLQAKALSLLAEVLRMRGDPGDFEQALVLLDRAIALQRRLLPAESDELTDSLSARVPVLVRMGKLVDAQTAAEEVLTRDLAKHGDDSLESASSKTGLATVLQEGGKDLQRAAKLMREALATQERTLGDHEEVLQSANNLACVLSEMRDDAGALEVLTKARDGLAARWKDHPKFTMVEQNLAHVLMRLGRFADAKKESEAALAAQRKLHPDGHADLAEALSCLGDVELAGGDAESAANNFGEAIEMLRRLSATDDPRFFEALIGAAEAWANKDESEKRDESESKDEFEKTEKYAEEALQHLRANPQADPILTVRALTMLGHAQAHRRQFEIAADALNEALEHAKALEADPLFCKARVQLYLGRLARLQKDLPGAESCFRDSVKSWREAGVPQHAEAIRAQCLLWRTLFDQRSYADAAKVASEGVETLRRLPDKKQMLADTLGDLANTLAEMKRFGDAVENDRERLGVVEKLYPRPHLQIALALSDLADLLKSDGKLDEADAKWSESCAMFEELGETRQSVYLGSLKYLAVFRFKRGDRAGSIPLLRKIVKTEREWGKEEALVADWLAILASAMTEERQFVDAALVAKECLTISEAKHPGKWEHRCSQALLGRALAGQGKLADAEPLLVEACTKWTPPPKMIAFVFDDLAPLDALAKLYEDSGRPEDAAKWRARRSEIERARAAANR